MYTPQLGNILIVEICIYVTKETFIWHVYLILLKSYTLVQEEPKVWVPKYIQKLIKFLVTKISICFH